MMNDDDLRKALVKLAHSKPSTRSALVPLLRTSAGWLERRRDKKQQRSQDVMEARIVEDRWDLMSKRQLLEAYAAMSAWRKYPWRDSLVQSFNQRDWDHSFREIRKEMKRRRMTPPQA
jgi:hypothetical protein